MVGAPGFEPGTSCTQSRRANHAALRPDHFYYTRWDKGQETLLQNRTRKVVAATPARLPVAPGPPLNSGTPLPFASMI